MKKIWGYIIGLLAVSAIAFTINWEYVGDLWEKTVNAVAELPTDKNDAGHVLVDEVKNMSVSKIINPSVIGFGGDNDEVPDDDFYKAEDFPVVPDKKISNLEKTKNGEELSEDAKMVNNTFRGDNFDKNQAFHSLRMKENKEYYSKLLDINRKCTCSYDKNLDKHLFGNEKFVALILQNEEDKKIWDDDLSVKKTRGKIEPIDDTTIMQKILPEDDAYGYICNGWNTVQGCVTRARDSAPYIYNT